ncbi:hypothetical protein [Mesorhizobium muleiense]
MAQMQEDFGTKIDWVAADHFNTGHPHSHVIVRGKDDRDENVVTHANISRLGSVGGPPSWSASTRSTHRPRDRASPVPGNGSRNASPA